MARRALPPTPPSHRPRRKLPETPPERLNRLAFELPSQHGIYPEFNILSIPIERGTKHRLFKSMIVVTEFFSYHTRHRIPPPRATASAVTASRPIFMEMDRHILRTHYFYSTQEVSTISHTRELLDPKTMAHLTCITQELNSPTEIENYAGWVTTYGIGTATDHSAFWYKLYGLYEDYLARQKGVTDRFFHPIDFSSSDLTYHFDLDTFPTAKSTAALPSSTRPGIPPPATYSATAEVWDSSTGIPLATQYAGETCDLGRALEWGTRGDNASPLVNVTGSLGATATALNGVGLLFENLDFFLGLEKESYKDPGTWLSGLTTAAEDASYALWIHTGVTSVAATGLGAAGCDAAVSGLAIISNSYDMYQHHKSKEKMAECLKLLEDYFDGGNRSSIARAIKKEIKGDDFRYHPECSSLYVMIAWLSRKYRRCLKGTAIQTTRNVAQFGLAIGIAVATAAAATATAGIILAVGVGLGMLYLLITVGTAAVRYSHNVEVLENYKTLIEQLNREDRISPKEYEQEKWLFELATRLHPVRHWASGATMGDYMRCKIAAFVIVAKQTFKALRATPTDERSILISTCADILGDAIDYDERKHGNFSSAEDLQAKTLQLAGDIPIRGY